MSKDPFKANLSISNTLIPKDTFAEKLRKYQLTESFAVDEKNKENKKKQSWWKEFVPDQTIFSSVAKGLIGVPKTITADIPQSVGEMFITDPYGYSFGDLNLDTKDPNHKEYVDAYNFIEDYKKTTNPFIGGDEGTKLLQSNGFENSFFGNQGVQTKRSDAEVKNILENSVVSNYTQKWSDWFQDKQNWYGDTSDKWINQLAETVPQFATQLLATVYGGPAVGMSYSGGLMFSDTYQNARPYVLKGELDVNEAHRLATTVGLVSFATNYAPSYVYSAYVKQPKLFKDILFNKFYQKGLHKNLTTETFKGTVFEGLQEGIDEFTSLTAESTYRNISSDEWWDRIITAGSIGMVLGGGSSVSLAHINNKNVKKEIIPKIIETENLLLPDIMKVDAEGNFKVDIKEENFSTKEDYENAKALVDNPDFKNKIDPYKIAEKNRQRELDGEQEVPLNMMIFNELNIDNPNTDDIDIVYNAKSFTSIMTDKELISKNYDPEEFISGEIKKGDSAYEEGKRKFKVWTLGSNIYNSSGGRILLTEGANQDVFVEEIVESLFKKLSTTNPELKQKIDKWIVDMGNLLDENKIGGVRGIELFSKWYTFNYLGYANQETDLKDVVALPEDIVKEFDKIMGEQKDGANVSFLFKGGDPIAEKQLEEFDIETKTEEITPAKETPEESFRLSPEKFSSMEIKLIETLIKENSVPLNSELEKYWSKSWINNINVQNELERLHNLYLRSQRKNLKKEQQQLLYEINNLRTRLDLANPLGYDNVDVTTISDELGLTLYDAFDKGIITEEERKNLAKFVQGKPIPKKLETNNELNNIEDIIVGLKDKYADKTVEGLRSWEQSPEESFRLTPQQEEFFKDSKVRDSGGNPYAEMLGLEKNYLLKVYHGTKNDFEEFKFLDSKTTNEHYAGDLGFWFTSEPKYKSTEYDEGNAEYMASEWANKFKDYGEPDPEGANVIPAYLNLKNPIEIYGYDLMHTPLKQQLIDTIKNKYNKDVKSGKEIREALLSEGIDGVHIIESFTDGNVFRDDWVAFKPEQIKSQFNVEPTSDPRMSYRLTPQKLSTINNFLMEVTKEGEPARFWYEQSGQAILDLVDGDVDKAKKLLSIIAITSPQMDVKTNFGQMIKGFYKYVQGETPEAGRFPTAMAKRIEAVMRGEEFEGIKTSSFYRNLLAQIESSSDRPVTVDMWMMRAFGFDKDVPTELEYRQIEKAVQNIAEQLGWEAHQVQASIWTSTKARWDAIFKQEMDKAKQSGRYKNGKWNSPATEKRFRNNLFKRLKKETIGDIEKSGYNYADALNDFKGVVSTETMPHPSTNIFDNANLIPFEEQLDYDKEIRDILTDENGKDRIAKLIGLLQVGKFNAPGFYEGDIAPSEHLEVLMSTSDVSINPETKKLLELYASIYGILTKQQAVGVTKVFKPKSKKQANVVMVDVKGSIPFEQIYSELLALGYNTGAIPQSYGYNIVNFDKKINNKKFQKDVENTINKIYENSSETIIFELGQSDGLYIENNWEENPNGESYKQRISKSEQQDAIKQFINSTSDEISKVNEKYKQKWSDKSFRLTSKPSLHLDPPTVLQNLATGLQDQMLRLKVVQEKIGEIPEDQDAYMQSELFIGTATEKIDNFRNETLEPLIKELTDAGFTIDDLGDYLYAKHSDERNKLINERNAEEILEIKEKIKNSKTEKTKQKYIQTLKELESKGSGMTQEDITLDDGTVIEGSKTILKKYKNTNIDQFADRVYNILNQRLDILYNNGMITKEDYDYFKSDKLFKNYVPLKGLPGDNTNPQIGKGFSILGKDIKKARGRESRANNPFIQTLLDFEESIVRTEKNKVTEAFYNLVIANPSDIWSAKGVKHIPRFNEWGDFQYLDPIDLKPNEIEVKIEGKRKIITINDPALLSSMQKLGSGKSIAILNGFNTFFRAINTTINPEFIITNFERDLQTGLFNLSADHKGLTKQVMKNVFKAQKGIWDNVKNKDSEWAKIYQEYKDNGGKIGWFDQMSLEDKTNKLESLLKKYKSKNMVGNSLRASKKLINDINEVVESGVRLSTYKALVDAGVSPKKSAQYSKNLTVNFNKKGEWGSWLNSLYVFSNAGIQGTTRVLKMAKTKRGKKIIGGLMAFGFMQSFLNRLIDDEEWEQFSDYNKDNYWMFMLPNGKCLSIKAPYGFNVFKTAGGLAEELMFGDLSLGDASKRLLKAVNDGFNPIGGGSPLQIISPTISDPFAQLIENKNFFGGPIMPEQPPYAPKVRDSKRYFKGARKIPKAITEWLNKITGGSEDVAGWIDVSPETIDHLTDAYTGGVGKFVANAVETGTSLAIDGKFPTANNLPIVRQFYKETDEWTSRGIVYDMINESGRKKFSKKERQKFSRHINYLKKGDFDRDKYTYTEWIKYLDEQNNTMSENQSNLK